MAFCFSKLVMRRSIPARRAGANLCQSLRRLTDIDVLFLKVLCGRGHSPGFQNFSKRFRA